MRLFLVRVDAARAEWAADRAWQAGAAGVWEEADREAVSLRIGVPDDRAATFRVDLGDLTPEDVTDETHPLASRAVDLHTPAGTLALEVPGDVFGDGDHPTTRGCLALVDQLVGPGSEVLDVGCGSGVLALAAAARGATVVAIDVAAEAVAAAEANARAAAFAIAASATPLAEVGGDFDVVLANLSAATLIDLAPQLWTHVRPGGRVVVSGVLAQQWDAVRVVLGGAVLDVIERDGWITALVAPGPAATRR